MNKIKRPEKYFFSEEKLPDSDRWRFNTLEEMRRERIRSWWAIDRINDIFIVDALWRERMPQYEVEHIPRYFLVCAHGEFYSFEAFDKIDVTNNNDSQEYFVFIYGGILYLHEKSIDNKDVYIDILKTALRHYYLCNYEGEEGYGKMKSFEVAIDKIIPVSDEMLQKYLSHYLW